MDRITIISLTARTLSQSPPCLRMKLAIELEKQMSKSETFDEFLTLPAYELLS